MNNDESAISAISPSTGKATWLGLFIALFGLLMARQIVSFFWPTPDVTSAICKEALIWLFVGALLLVIRCGERLPLSTVGLGTARWWKSILWGVAIAAACLLSALVLVRLTNYGQNNAGAAFSKLPTWLIVLIVFRAGIVEELFYRGYAIERLQALGLSRVAAAAIPLAIFALAHWTGGWGNIVIALVLGAVLTGFYLWRRDLVANMIGHFLTDLLANMH